MGNSDSNRSLPLSSVLLNENNYGQWSRVVTLSLGGKKNLGFINGTIVCPPVAYGSKTPATSTDESSATDTASIYADWLSSGQLVRSWLLNSMEPHIAGIFTFSDSVNELRDYVEGMFGSKNNIARVFEIKNEITATLQGDQKFSEFFGHMKRLWDELNMYRPHTTDAQTLLQRAEEDDFFSLLNNLKPKYEYLKSNILMTTPLPSLLNVCATIQREETRKKTMTPTVQSSSVTIDSSALVATKPDRRNTSDSEKKKGIACSKGRLDHFRCDHCGKIGHTKDHCWTLHPHLKSTIDRIKKDHVVVADTSTTVNQLSQLLDDLRQSMSSSPSQSASSHTAGSHFKDDDW